MSNAYFSDSVYRFHDFDVSLGTDVADISHQGDLLGSLDGSQLGENWEQHIFLNLELLQRRE